MGRKSLLETLREEITVPNNRDRMWMLTYDFPGFSPSPHFYKLLSDYMEELIRGGAVVERIQTSVVVTNDLHGLIVMGRLAERYEAQVFLCEIKEQDLVEIQRLNARLDIRAEERYHVFWMTFFHNKDRLSDYVMGESEALIGVLLGLISGADIHVENVTDQDSLGILEKLIESFIESPVKFSEPFTLTGPQVWLVLSALRRHITRFKMAEMSKTAFRILWRLNNEVSPPEFNRENVEGLLGEYPIEVWEAQYIK